MRTLKYFKSNYLFKFSDVDEWNLKRKEMLHLLMNEVKSNPYFMGFVVPLRTPSYILGYQPNGSEQEKKFLWNKKRERTFRGSNEHN